MHSKLLRTQHHYQHHQHQQQQQQQQAQVSQRKSNGRAVMTTKTSSVPTWHQTTAEKRTLRKQTKLGPPDVHPQDPRQEEDNLGRDRLSRGYQLATTPFEHDSLVFNSRSLKLEKLDECLGRSQGVLAFGYSRKGDINATLDKERRKSKENANAQFAVPQVNIPNAIVRERALWFTDLAKGKPLGALAKRVPLFIKNKEEILDYLCDYKIPSYRALWFLKISAALSSSQQVKTKKSVADSFGADYRLVFNQSIAQMMSKMWSIKDLYNSHIYRDRWVYIVDLVRKAFDDGVFEKQEFINELCETFSDFYLRGRHGGDGKHGEDKYKGEENPAHLRVFLLLLSQFVKYINLNLILARRTAHMLAMKLRLIKMEYDDRAAMDPPIEHKTETPTENRDEDSQTPKEATVPLNIFHTLVRCKTHKNTIYLLTALLQEIVMESPASVIWNKFKVTTNRLPFIITQLCGSPLDHLPCPVYELPVPPGKESERFLELLKMRNTEVMRRSQAVQDHWTLNSNEHRKFSRTIALCLNIIGTMDAADLFEKDVVRNLAEKVFDGKPKAWETDAILRIKMMMHWAVTSEREGTYRACIVAKVIKAQIGNQGTDEFGGKSIQDIILQYFNRDSPKAGSANFDVEFGATMALFSELIRYGLFSHDTFVKYMITNFECRYEKPVMPQYVKPPPPPINNGQPEFEDLTPDEPPPPTGLILPRPEVKDEHILTTTPMWYKHKILFQVPLPQTEEHRSAANQRALILYGMGDARENHNNELKTVAREICKIWQKRIFVQLYTDTNQQAWCPRRQTAQKVQAVLSKFRAQTYYDQVVICGWCAESFSDMIRDFVTGHSLQMPTSEGLDILCSMFESAEYIYGIFDLCEAMLPLFPLVEKVVRSLAADVIPGTLADQLAFVFVSYLSKHWHFYLHSGRAPYITNLLYALVEREIRASDFPRTSWGRSVAAFVYHSKVQLKKSKLTTIPIKGNHSDFLKVFDHGSSSNSDVTRYNGLFFKDVLETKLQLRFYSYHEYKKRLPSFDQLQNRYSFVINTLISVKETGRDYDRLADLSAFCGHISAQIPALADEWIAAIKVLCCSSSTHHQRYRELLSAIDITNCETHYPIATFVMLMAGKYAFSVPKLVAELLNNVFPQVMKKDQWGSKDHESEPGVCLALQILANICCKSDEPILLSEHYKGTLPKNKFIPQSADENILSMIQWCEMDNVLFPMLSNICILQDTLKGRHKDMELELPRIVNGTPYRKEYLTILVRTVLSAMCEEEWVTQKMYDIVETNNMEAFNHDRLKQECLGQQLLRMGIRRRSEREIVRELTVCNGNSKRALVDKLLTCMNMWNMRATLFDLRLIIKENSPEGAQKHQQQGVATAAALMGEIGKCCRELFTTAHKDGKQLPQAILTNLEDRFRFSDISNYWLIAILVRLCPEPTNVPSSFQPMTVSGCFLKEAASMLDTANDSSRERIQQSAWLLSQQSFVNLVLACMKCEKDQGGKDNKDLLVKSLYRQLQDITQKTKDNPALPHMVKFSAEREGLLLRLSLVGGIFEQICNSGATDNWSLLFFQMLLHGLISPDKDRILYDSVYDMMSTLMLWTLVEETNQNTSTNSGTDGHTTPVYRWPLYTQIIKKLRSELKDQRVPIELRQLHQFVPIPKNNHEILQFEPYGTQPQIIPTKSTKLTVQQQNALACVGVRHGRLALQPLEKVKLSCYDFVNSYVPDINSKGGWRWSMFQASKLDRMPVPIQKSIGRMLQHKHLTDFTRTLMIIPENSASDVFLSAPQVEAGGDVVTSTAASSTTASTTTVTSSTVTATSGEATTSTTSATDTVPVLSPATPVKETQTRPESKGSVDIEIISTVPAPLNLTSTPTHSEPTPVLNTNVTPETTKSRPNATSASPKSRGGGSGGRKRGQGMARQPGGPKAKRTAAPRADPTPLTAGGPSHPGGPPQFNSTSAWPNVSGYSQANAHSSGISMNPPMMPAMQHPMQPPMMNTELQSQAAAHNQTKSQTQDRETKEKLHSLLTKRMEVNKQQQPAMNTTSMNVPHPTASAPHPTADFPSNIPTRSMIHNSTVEFQPPNLGQPMPSGFPGPIGPSGSVGGLSTTSMGGPTNTSHTQASQPSHPSINRPNTLPSALQGPAVQSQQYQPQHHQVQEHHPAHQQNHQQPPAQQNPPQTHHHQQPPLQSQQQHQQSHHQSQLHPSHQQPHLQAQQHQPQQHQQASHQQHPAQTQAPTQQHQTQQAQPHHQQHPVQTQQAQTHQAQAQQHQYAQQHHSQQQMQHHQQQQQLQSQQPQHHQQHHQQAVPPANTMSSTAPAQNSSGGPPTQPFGPTPQQPRNNMGQFSSRDDPRHAAMQARNGMGAPSNSSTNGMMGGTLSAMGGPPMTGPSMGGPSFGSTSMSSASASMGVPTMNPPAITGPSMNSSLSSSSMGGPSKSSSSSGPPQLTAQVPTGPHHFEADRSMAHSSLGGPSMGQPGMASSGVSGMSATQQLLKGPMMSSSSSAPNFMGNKQQPTHPGYGVASQNTSMASYGGHTSSVSKSMSSQGYPQMGAPQMGVPAMNNPMGAPSGISAMGGHSGVMGGPSAMGAQSSMGSHPQPTHNSAMYQHQQQQYMNERMMNHPHQHPQQYAATQNTHHFMPPH